jgi:hypothetical protein
VDDSNPGVCSRDNVNKNRAHDRDNNDSDGSNSGMAAAAAAAVWGLFSPLWNFHFEPATTYYIVLLVQLYFTVLAFDIWAVVYKPMR